MITQLRNVVARWQVSRMRKHVEPHAFSFPADLMTPKHVLVCLPGRLRELTLVKQFLPTITNLFKTADITLLAIPGVKVADMYPRKGYHILTPSEEQLTWSGLPKKSYLATLRDYKYDMLIDLNLEHTLFTQAILLSFPTAVRLGRGNHLGNPFYNFEIKTKYLRDEKNIYRSLLETVGTIINRPITATAHTGQ